ncbi:hypothetical protein [Celeribacter neptunius]|uniref:Hydrogenase expression/formation protein HupK n=1 Tax=Celeribacter neptunius TaxID=588602 RepID=A0A1I3NIW0_9RHOB|nr:hypothetical protein [Celeribacter neptunius]SFJ09211.1 hypothetical protein SAMN04487991_1384 [Celeribacter neptunius]
MRDDPMNTAGAERLHAVIAPDLPIAQLVIGKPVEEVAMLVPRLFNLCRSAQEAAVRLALDLPLAGDVQHALCADFARDHLMRLGIIVPRGLGIEPLPVAQGAAALLPEVMPASDTEFEEFLSGDDGFAPLFKALDEAFEAGEAIADLPAPAPGELMSRRACENSTAGRHLDHPLMQVVEARKGRGPLWRATARMLDLAACLKGEAPAPTRLADGTAMVPASRGSYVVKAAIADGQVAEFTRTTPTDHLMAPGGIMEQSLASLPPAKHHLAQVVIDILDPCTVVELRGGALGGLRNA